MAVGLTQIFGVAPHELIVLVNHPPEQIASQIIVKIPSLMANPLEHIRKHPKLAKQMIGLKRDNSQISRAYLP